MKTLRLTSLRLAAVVLLALPLAAARAADETAATVKFSDPAKPGTLKIQLARGDLRIEGTDTAEIAVIASAQPVTGKPRKDGLRVLTAASSYTLTEKDNVVTLDALGDGWMGAPSDFKLTVPRATQIVVQNSFGGDITCRGVTGDLEINSMNGQIRLDGVTGGVVVATMNGEITATVAKLQEGKPLSFTSMNGEVVLRLPGDAKANVRLRTQNGSVLTDFDDAALVTKTENAPRSAGSNYRYSFHSDHTGGVLPPEAREAIREAGRVGAEVAREVALAVKEAAEAARAGAAEARRESSSSSSDVVEVPAAPKPPKPGAAPKAPRAPKAPTIPTITGGKLVTGTLNGGGPEISVATMNGDVTLRKTTE